MGVEVVLWRKERREDGFCVECEVGEEVRGEEKMGLREEEEAMGICFWLLALFSLCGFVCVLVTKGERFYCLKGP